MSGIARILGKKNYLTQIIYDVIQNYSLQLRDIEKILLKFSIIINFVPETHALCLPFLIDLIILNTYYPHIYNYIKGKTPADNYNSSEKLQKLRSETFSIIKVMNYEKYSENNIYHCRNDLKNYFNLIDFAQDFNI